MNNKFKYLIVFLLVGLVALYLYNKYRVAPGVDFNKLDLSNIDGGPVKFTDFAGKKMILSFGASWCGNCIMELKALNKLKDNDFSGIEIVIISDEDIEIVKQFKEKRGPSFTFLKMKQDFNSVGVNVLPTTYIFNTKSERVYESVGDINWDDRELIERFKKLMN